MKKLFIFGAGFTAQNFVEKNGQNFLKIYGTTRDEKKLEFLQKLGIDSLLFKDENLTKALSQSSHLLISIGPEILDEKIDKNNDPVLENFSDFIAHKMPKLEQIIYLSTVGVYGNHDGEWVNEETPCKPTSKRSHARLKAEHSWQKFSQQNNIPLAIFRLSGIYGKNRNTFVNIEKGKARRLVKKNQVFNRIHVADISDAILKGFSQKTTGIFNITDDEPAPPQNVVKYACELMQISPPPEIDFESADLTPMARSFYGENKRVSNQKSKDVLQQKYIYKNYKIALQKMLDEKSWKD